MKFKTQEYSDGSMYLISESKETGERIASMKVDKNISIADLKKECNKWKAKGASQTTLPTMTKQEDFDPDA